MTIKTATSKLGLFTCALLLMCSTVACHKNVAGPGASPPTPPEQQARNAIATATGAIADGQKSYTAECNQNPAEEVCKLINRLVDAQNAAITSLESYCSYPVSPKPPDAGAVCVPVSTALGGLQIATTNLNQLISELKSAVGTSRPAAPAKQSLSMPPRRDPQREPLPIPFQAGLSPEAVAVALLSLRVLLSNLLKGTAGEVANESISAVQAGIAELESVQGTPVTYGQLEGMRLHHLWPSDAPPLPGAPDAGTSATAASPGDAAKTS